MGLGSRESCKGRSPLLGCLSRTASANCPWLANAAPTRKMPLGTAELQADAFGGRGGHPSWSQTSAENRFVRIGRCQVLAWRRLFTLGGVCFHPPTSRGSPVGSPSAGGVGGWCGARPVSVLGPGASPWALAPLTDQGGRSSVGRLSIPSVSTSERVS